MADLVVRVHGLNEFRRDLRASEPGMLREVQQVTRDAAQMVATEAARRAPRRSGRLAASVRGTTAGAKGVVRSPLVYAPVHEFGGTISPHGGPIRIRASRFVQSALEAKQDEIQRALANGLDQVVRRHGWH